MSDLALPVQEAVYAALLTDTTLQNGLSGIYDLVPDDAAYPYVAIEDVRSDDWSFQGGNGALIRMQLVAYSRYSGKQELYAILERMKALLHEATLSADAAHIVQMRVTQTQFELLRDARTGRATMQLEIYVHE